MLAQHDEGRALAVEVVDGLGGLVGGVGVPHWNLGGWGGMYVEF